MRFKQTDQPRHWRDLAFCLALLPYTTEKAMKRLVESLPFYQDKLHEPAVFAHFEEILNKVCGAALFCAASAASAAASACFVADARVRGLERGCCAPPTKTRKFQKAEVKAIADEFEGKLRELHSLGVENEVTVAKAALAVKKATTAPAKARTKKVKSVGFANEPDVFDVIA